MPVFSERVLTAKKAHHCNGCRATTISPGERYTRMFGQAESHEKAYELKYCSYCRNPEEASKPKPDGYAYIREYYKTPVFVGQVVECQGVRGEVVPVGDRPGHYLSVKVKREGQKRPQVEVWHPTWETVYYAEDGETILADYRVKKEAVTA